MSTTKFTKGEWKITDDRFIAVDEKELVCEVYDRANFLPRPGTIVPDEETAEANAKLIAAAPEMFEALKTMLMFIKESSGIAGWHENGQVATWDEFDVVKDIETAIKKATT